MPLVFTARRAWGWERRCRAGQGQGRDRAGSPGQLGGEGALLSRNEAGRVLLVLGSLVPGTSAHSSLVGWREGAEADVLMRQSGGTEGGWPRLRHPHLCCAWAGAARAGGSGVMPCRSRSCWLCRRGFAPLRSGTWQMALCLAPSARPGEARPHQGGLSPRRPSISRRRLSRAEPVP